MANKRMLFIIDRLSSSGASKIISWLAENFQKTGYDSTIISHSLQEPKTDSCGNCTVINYNASAKGRISRTLGYIRFLRKHFKDYTYDSCIVFLPVECLLVLMAGIRNGTRLIFCERSDPYFERSILASIGRFGYRFADFVVFQTKGAQDYFPDCIVRKSAIIPNPAFSNALSVIPMNERRNEIAYSGRLFIKQKRQDILLEAFLHVAERFPEFKLIVYGDGPDKKRLMDMATNIGVGDSVVFKGNVDDVEEEIRYAKLLVLSSDYEGIPNVIIEALQCGVPVVSTDCSPGGAKALIQQGKNGYIVPRGDAKKLAESIIDALSKKLNEETIIEDCVDSVKAFDEKQIFQQWVDVINTDLNNRNEQKAGTKRN